MLKMRKKVFYIKQPSLFDADFDVSMHSAIFALNLKIEKIEFTLMENLNI